MAKAKPAKVENATDKTSTTATAVPSADAEAIQKAKAEKEAAAAAKRAEKQAAADARKAASEAKKAERQAKADALAAEGKSTNLSMLALTDKVKAGVYVKGATGQFRSNDELAQAFDEVPPVNVVATALELLKLDNNPYAALNAGQQSMNLRNKLRTAIKAGTVTIDQVKDCIATHGYATAGIEKAAKAAAKEARAKAFFEKAEAKKAEKAAKAAEAKKAEPTFDTASAA